MLTTILLGGLTHHFLGSSLPYCNRINNFGSIVNPYAVVMRGTEDLKAGFILGTDSACGSIVGPVSSFKLSDNVDFIAGAYNTNFKEFNKLGIEPPSIAGLTPIVGINYKVKLNKTLSLNNIVSVGIISHAISFSF